MRRPIWALGLAALLIAVAAPPASAGAKSCKPRGWGTIVTSRGVSIVYRPTNNDEPSYASSYVCSRKRPRPLKIPEGAEHSVMAVNGDWVLVSRIFDIPQGEEGFDLDEYVALANLRTRVVRKIGAWPRYLEHNQADLARNG